MAPVDGPGPGQTSTGLVRALGRWDLTAVGVNQVIGSGIFVLPASVALLVGRANSFWPYVLAGIANVLVVACFAEASTRFRDAGGPYLYARNAFGPFVGFEVAWMLWLTRVSSQAALANALALYLGYFWAGAASGLGRIAVVWVTILVLAAINVAGVRYGSWTINFFTVSKLGPLLGFAVVGFWFVDWSVFATAGSPISAGTGEAVLLLMFAFGGYELVTLPAGEATSPRRDVPRALLTTIAAVCAIYVLVQVVTAGTLEGVATSTTPLADSAGVFLGPLAGLLIAFGGMLSIAGSNAGSMLAGPRITFALGERGQLPRTFAHVHRRFRTPDFSILVFAAVAMALAASGTFAQMAKVSAVSRLVFYLATCAAVPVLRHAPGTREDAFRLPGGMMIPAAAAIASLLIMFGGFRDDPVPLLAGGTALLVGGALYAIAGRRA